MINPAVNSGGGTLDCWILGGSSPARALLRIRAIHLLPPVGFRRDTELGAHEAHGPNWADSGAIANGHLLARSEIEDPHGAFRGGHRGATVGKTMMEIIRRQGE